jgi:DNA modification methylase
MKTTKTIQALDAKKTDDWAMYNGDCVEVVRQLPDKSVDFEVFSPPFANVYLYSDSTRDMGNCDNEAEFMHHYRYLARELYRVLRPGRLCAVHCKDTIRYKGAHGRAGMHDLPGDIVRVMEEAGFQYHCRVTVWKCPVEEQRKTKNHGLLYKQLRKDSSFSRVGMPEYVLLFRRWADEDREVDDVRPVGHTRETFPLERWQKWASPVWMDVRHTDVLNVRAARDDRDERHMCPLSLDLIERCCRLWSNPGDIVLSPFGGVGSEGVGALRAGRRFVGVELKPSYFRQAVKNLQAESMSDQVGLFG